MNNLRRRPIAVLLLGVMLLAAMAFPAREAAAFGRGAAGPDVYAVQAMLKSLGYFPATITGYYGRQTEAAVRQFQKAYGLPQTGAVDARTLQSILWAYESQKIPKTPSPKPPPRPSPPSGEYTLTAEEKQMADLVNAARRDAGLPPLIVDWELSRVARFKSQDMVAKNYFSHDSPTYGSPFEMMKNFGIAFRSAGENIACNQSVSGAHQSLMNSSGHRANILSKDFTHLGIGIADGGPCGKMFTEQFVGR